MTTAVRSDKAWAALAGLDEEARIAAMRQRFGDLAALDEGERLEWLREMTEAEYALPEADLAAFTLSRLRTWIALAREYIEVARLLGAAYDRVFAAMPADMAMKRATMVQSVASRHLSAEETDVLFEVVPGLVRQLPRRRAAVVSPQKAQAQPQQRGSFWRRVAGAG